MESCAIPGIKKPGLSPTPPLTDHEVRIKPLHSEPQVT